MWPGPAKSLTALELEELKKKDLLIAMLTKQLEDLGSKPTAEEVRQVSHIVTSRNV
jgi:hypothetical protein